MKSISSDVHDSCPRDCVEAIKQFHWDTVWLELLQKVNAHVPAYAFSPKTNNKNNPCSAPGITTVETQAPATGTESCVSNAIWKWHCQAGNLILL